MRRKIADQQIDQRGFAAAVRPDYADFVAARDDGVEVPNQRPVAVIIADTLRFDDDFARFLRIGKFERRDAFALPPLLALFAHRQQCFDAAFIARPPRLDAAPNPDFFLREFFIETFPFFFLIIEQRLLAFEEGVVIARPVGQFAAI